ncbi:hypothetical protein IFR04_012456 [Cadophora malorum]|uniref:Uncharacterized protein n=1 Tax=Cadophora malorum TaxID=108018 RepID=A0A8H7T8V9_9HELO|nr:hypothetical protein IFR04_012456 [Cadophora malorum]
MPALATHGAFSGPAKWKKAQMPRKRVQQGALGRNAADRARKRGDQDAGAGHVTGSKREDQII